MVIVSCYRGTTVVIEPHLSEELSYLKDINTDVDIFLRCNNKVLKDSAILDKDFTVDCPTEIADMAIQFKDNNGRVVAEGSIKDIKLTEETVRISIPIVPYKKFGHFIIPDLTITDVCDCTFKDGKLLVYSKRDKSIALIDPYSLNLLEKKELALGKSNARTDGNLYWWDGKSLWSIGPDLSLLTKTINVPDNASVCFAEDGDVVVSGGKINGETITDITFYNRDGRIKSVSDMIVPRYDHGSIIFDNRLIVLGGVDSESSKTLEILTLDNTSHKKIYLSVTFEKEINLIPLNNRLLLLGLSDNDSFESLLFDPKNITFESTEIQERHNYDTVIGDNYVYLTGGFNRFGNPYDSVLKIDKIHFLQKEIFNEGHTSMCGCPGYWDHLIIIETNNRIAFFEPDPWWLY